MNNVSVQQIVNALIGLGGVLGALTTIVTFFYIALFRPFRNFLRKEIVSSLDGISDTLLRTEERLITHITNPIAHQQGETNAGHTTTSVRSESRNA